MTMDVLKELAKSKQNAPYKPRGVSGIAIRIEQEAIQRNFAERVENMKKQLDQLKKSLDDFTQRNKNDILKKPEFRVRFHRLLEACKIDPISSGKNAFSGLGLGKFYYELSVQVVDVCYSTRSQNGGIIQITELQRQIGILRNHRDEISVKDILKAIEKLKILNSGYEIRTVGNQILVQSVPSEFNDDNKLLIELAQRQNGHFSKLDVKREYKWDDDRIKHALDNLMKDGIAMIDEQDPSRTPHYWIVGILRLRADNVAVVESNQSEITQTVTALERK